MNKAEAKSGLKTKRPGSRERELAVFSTDSYGVRRKYDLSRFATGVTGSHEGIRSFRGRPQMIREMLAAIELRVQGLKPSTVVSILKELNHFWVFCDRLEAEAAAEKRPSPDTTGGERGINSLSDLPASVWQLYALHLMHSGLAAQTVAYRYDRAYEIVNDAARTACPGRLELFRPRFKLSNPPARLHSDLNHAALQFLHYVCLHELKGVGASFLQRHLDAGFGAETDGTSPDTCAGAMNILREHLAAMARGDPGPGLECFDPLSPHYRRRVQESLIEQQGITEYMRVLAPDRAEVLAAFAVIAGRTGWLDTAHQFDATRNWHSAVPAEDLADPSIPMVVIRSLRPKTGRIQFQLSGYGANSPYSILVRMIERTRYLRELAASAADRLRRKQQDGRDSWEDLQELERLEKVSVSPFAYLTPVGEGTGCFKILFPSRMGGYRHTLNALIKRAAPPRFFGEQWKPLMEAVRKLKLADLRHASAERVYRKTGSLHATQMHLGHAVPKTTMAYLNQRRLLIELYREFSKLAGILCRTIEEGRSIEPYDINVRFLSDGLAEADQELQDRLRSADRHMSRSGVLCNWQTGNGAGDPEAAACPYDRCVICHNGVLIPDMTGVFEALAMRFAKVRHRIELLGETLEPGNLLEFERITIVRIRDRLYPDRADDFNRLAEDSLQTLRSRGVDNG